MFGHMKTQPILTVATASTDPAIAALLAITENAQPVRWIEFPTSILLLVSIQGDEESGAFYLFDRRTSTWFWIDFDVLVREYDFLSLVERPGLLRAAPGWLLEPRKPAEMAAPSK